jgi:hypothetical protein
VSLSIRHRWDTHGHYSGCTTTQRGPDGTHARCRGRPSGASCREARLLASKRIDQGFGATLRNREARTKGLGTPHEGFFRRGHIIRRAKWSYTDRHQPGPAVTRVAGPRCRYRYRGCRISDPLLWAVPPLWLHHRFSECSLAPIPLREMQSAFPLVPLLSRRNGLAYRLQCKVCQPSAQPPRHHSLTTAPYTSEPASPSAHSSPDPGMPFPSQPDVVFLDSLGTLINDSES